MPNPRLTGLGGGLFCGAVMFALACVDQLLFGASLAVYGVLFLPVCALTAWWVRRGDLLTAPVVVPLAFAFGLLPLADSSGGSGAPDGPGHRARHAGGLAVRRHAGRGCHHGGAQDPPDEPPSRAAPPTGLTGLCPTGLTGPGPPA